MSKKPEDYEFRSSNVKKFFTTLNLEYHELLQQHFTDIGAEYVEDLKNLEEEDWINVKSIMHLKLLQERKLNKAVELLNRIPFDPKLVQPLPIEDSIHKSTPKAASKHSSSRPQLKSMNGGNLQKIDKIFPSSNVDLTDLTSDSDDSIAVVSQGMIEHGPKSDWREHRASEVSPKHLDTLYDVLPDYEKKLWTYDQVQHSDFLKQSETKKFRSVTANLQDYLGYYKVLGKDLSRETPIDVLKQMYKERKSWYRTQARKCHPDHNPDCKEAKKEWENLSEFNSHIEKAFSVLCTDAEDHSNDNGIILSGRFWYDARGNQLVNMWRFHTKYDEDATKEEHMRKLNSSTISVAMKKWNSTQTPIEICVTLYNNTNHSQQKNVWRLAVSEALKSGATKSSISRAICIKKGSPGWDGNANKCKEYKSIWQKVNNANKGMKSSGLNDHSISTMGHKEKKRFLQRKHASTEVQRKRPKKESRKEKMEVDVFKYIQDLCGKSRRVTTPIIFRKVIELHPLFLGGPDDDCFMQKIRNWFYYSFSRK